MAVTELIAEMRSVFQIAIEKAALGEDVTWDLMWGAIPSPTGPQTAYLCYLHCAALHMLGALLQRSFAVPIGSQPEVIEHLVGQQVRALFDERSRLLTTQSNGKLIIEG